MKFINSITIFFLFFCAISVAQKPAASRKEFRENCDGGNKRLVNTESYNSAQKVIRSVKENKRNTEYRYDEKGNLVIKIHRDSTGKLIRFNKIYYNEDNEYSVDTLFNSDSTANTIFRRRHSKKPNEDILTWDILGQKGSTIIQTIKLDDQKNEIENTICTSSSECTIIKNTFSGSQKIKTETFRTEEMNRKPVLTETQTFEYNSSGKVIKSTVTDEINKLCSYVLTYTYE